jgi:hypothetical protein
LGFQPKRDFHDAYSLGFSQSAVFMTPTVWVSAKAPSS